MPLPWTRGGSTFGFGPDHATAPWLPQPSWWGDLSVEAQEHDPASMLALYRTMLRLRRTIPELASGAFAWFEPGIRDVVAFQRGAAFACVVNLGGTPAALPDGEVLLASGPLTPDRALPQDTAVWLRI